MVLIETEVRLATRRPRNRMASRSPHAGHDVGLASSSFAVTYTGSALVDAWLNKAGDSLDRTTTLPGRRGDRE